MTARFQVSVVRLVLWWCRAGVVAWVITAGAASPAWVLGGHDPECRARARGCNGDRHRCITGEDVASWVDLVYWALDLAGDLDVEGPECRKQRLALGGDVAVNIAGVDFGRAQGRAECHKARQGAIER